MHVLKDAATYTCVASHASFHLCVQFVGVELVVPLLVSQINCPWPSFSRQYRRKDAAVDSQAQREQLAASRD
jgi:hypothetical protein